MDKFLMSLEKKLLPLAEKLNGQRHLAALRDGFIAVMPLLIIGAFAVMLNSVFFDLSEGSLIASLFLTNPVDPANYPLWLQFIREMNNIIVAGTLGIVALAVSFTIAYNLTEIKGYRGVEAGIISVGAFVMSFSLSVIDPISENLIPGAISTSLLGSANIITAILLAFFCAEIYTFMLKHDFRIKMPSSVPPAVERSFSALLPGIVIFIAIAFFQALLMFGFIPFTNETSISMFIQTVIGAPLRAIGGGYAGMFVYVAGIDIFWFFGIHGPNTLAFMDQAIFTPAGVQNASLVSQGIINAWGIVDPTAYAALSDVEQASVYSKTLLDSYVFIGGSGATLGLIIAILVSSKREADRKIAKYSLTPALFNINEPLLFGLPIVFNPILFIPFVLIQPILFTSAIIAINIGIIPMYGIVIPWTSPVGIGAFLGYGGSIAALIFAFFQLFLATLIYYPFVVIMNKANKNADQKRQEEGEQNV